MTRNAVQPALALRTRKTTVTLAEAKALKVNPWVHDVRALRRVGENAYVVEVRYLDPPAPPEPQRRWRVEGLGRYARVMAVVFGVPAALLGIGWTVAALWGDQIAAGLRTVGLAALAVVVLLIVVWVASLTTGKCPGLHCPGCGHK